MPIYEYQCDACDARFEELTSLRGDDATSCRSCGSRTVTRLLSAFAVGGGGAGAPAVAEAGPCGCGAPRRGMCGE